MKIKYIYKSHTQECEDIYEVHNDLVEMNVLDYSDFEIAVLNKANRKVEGFYLRNGKLNYDRYNDFWHNPNNYLSDRELFNYMIEQLEGEDFEMLVLNETSGVYEHAREEHFTNL